MSPCVCVCGVSVSVCDCRMESAPYISRLAIPSSVAGGRAPSMDPLNTGGTRDHHGSIPNTRRREQIQPVRAQYVRTCATTGTVQCMCACTHNRFVCLRTGGRVQCIVPRDLRLFGFVLSVSSYPINIPIPPVSVCSPSLLSVLLLSNIHD